MEACKKHAAAAIVLHKLFFKNPTADKSIVSTVNIVSRTYTARLAKERLDGQL
jgi:hypothetical protein